MILKNEVFDRNIDNYFRKAKMDIELFAPKHGFFCTAFLFGRKARNPVVLSFCELFLYIKEKVAYLRMFL